MPNTPIPTSTTLAMTGTEPCWELTVHEPNGTTSLLLVGYKPATEAGQLASYLADTEGCTVEIIDRAAELATRFPEGTRVRHTTTGHTGTVTPSTWSALDSSIKTTTWVDGSSGVQQVSVQLDGHRTARFVASFIEPIAESDKIDG